MANTQTRPMFGWDLIYSSHESSICKKEDLLILLVHWSLTHKRFKCCKPTTHGVVTVEVSSSNTTHHSASEISLARSTVSEVLPQGWNSATDGSYVIHYALDEIPFILRASRLDDVIIINLLHCSDNTVSSLALQPDNLVKGLTGSIENMIPEYKSVLNMIENKLITPVHCTSHEAETQTVKPQRGQVQSLPSSWHGHITSSGSYPDLNPSNIGRTDLDPLGGTSSGSGMIFDPFRRDRSVPLGAGTLPEGSVPPGARFDPVGPLNPQPEVPRPLRPGGFQPDPDHLPPPGFDDFLM